MTKSLCTLLILSLLAWFQPVSAWARRPAPPKSQYRWERMRVEPALPSQVFARLGLTHTTRHGFTRDGFVKGTPDPTFPAGLTDVVPYDETHLLLLRGTPQGLAQFRERVLATETEIAATGRWRVSVDLLSAETGAALASSDPQDVQSDAPFRVTLAGPDGALDFQLRVHVNADAITTVSCQAGLLSAAGAAANHLTPAQVWTAPATRPVLPGDTALFNDSAFARLLARRHFGLPDQADTQDYQIRVNVVSLSAPPYSGQAVPAPVSTPPADRDSIVVSPPMEDNAASRP